MSYKIRLFESLIESPYFAQSLLSLLFENHKRYFFKCKFTIKFLDNSLQQWVYSVKRFLLSFENWEDVGTWDDNDNAREFECYVPTK